ncbi:MAG: TRAP transporter large permease subunit [Deltaproteobacteria bacterium]|nr:TRAP transporter large permease subunit [Deltaproteobacteria bacterium]
MSTERTPSSAVEGGGPRGIVDRVDVWLQRGQEWAVFSLLVLLVGLTFVQVVLRNLPGNPSLPWIDLASRLLVLWVGLLGASLAVAREKHISIDIAGRVLPARLARWVRGATGAMALLVLVVLVHASLDFTLVKHQSASLPLFTIDSLGLKVYEYAFTDLVPVLFLLMLWHTWVLWLRGLGDNRPVRVAGYVVGVLLAVLVVLVAVVDIGGGAGGLVLLAEGSLGAMLRQLPYLFLALSGVLALLGAPLYVVIGAVALIGHYSLEAIPVQNFVSDGIGGFRKSTIFLAIPLFTLAGYLMAEGNTPKRLVGLFRGFLGWMPGGVAIVALIACSFFTAFTGASGVTIIALGGLLYPILREDRYSEKFVLGLLTTGGSRGLIFPPSIPVFLLAMIMGLSWDAVTATGPFGSAVMPQEQRTALCREEAARMRAEIALDEQLSSGDGAIEEDIDRLLEQRLHGAGVARSVEETAAPRDEFELGDDEGVGAPGGAPTAEESGGPEEGRDEFELGDDEGVGAPGGAPTAEESGGTEGGRDEFELGDDAAVGSGEGTGGEEVAAAAGSESAAAAADGAVSAESSQPLPIDPAAPASDAIAVPSSTQIFTAGLLPGILMVLAIAVYCIIAGFSGKVVRTRFQLRSAGRALLDARWELPIPILIGVGIFGGFFTPAEAASATAVYTLLMQLVLYRDFGFKTVFKAFVDSIVLVGGILVILVAAMGLLNFLVVAKVPDLVLSLIENLVPEELPVFGLFSIPRQITFLLMLNLFLLIVGCLMDIFSAILVVLPLLLPIAYRFGIHPAHLAVIFLTNLEIGYSTPPVGINLFVASLRFEKPVVKLYAASMAYLGIMLVGLLVITYWPQLSLWLISVTGVQ